jgi:Sigma-70 region 2
MASTSAGDLGLNLGRLFGAGSAVGLTDGELFERFAHRRDEAAGAAFETILARHGAMVLTVCRQVLSDAHAAEDAFQATFLTMLRRSGSLARPQAGVARSVVARGGIPIWDLASGRERRRWHEVPGFPEHLTFSPDGRTLAAELSTQDQTTLKVRHAITLWEGPFSIASSHPFGSRPPQGQPILGQAGRDPVGRSSASTSARRRARLRELPQKPLRSLRHRFQPFDLDL